MLAGATLVSTFGLINQSISIEYKLYHRFAHSRPFDTCQVNTQGRTPDGHGADMRVILSRNDT